MRPLTLTIEGLRSFRSPVEISFQGRDHVAIIGDTGAGKSSILEAMTYALFGRTTFSGHANQEIMNDLAGYMRVTLRFTVGGLTFEVTRVLRRASDRTVGAAKASLTEFAPDGTEIRKIEQVRLVNNRIQEALGLDADAFLRTVVLPQGQFAQLLVGDDPAARAAILRQVWRTDELTRAGQLADEALPPLSQLVGQVTQALAGTPENPQAHLQHLKAAAEQCLNHAKRAHDTHSAATAARNTMAEAGKSTEAAENVLKKITGFDFPLATATAEEVVRSAATIAAQRGTAEKEQEVLREQLRAGPPNDDGLDHQAIGAARTILDHLPSQADAAVKAAARARADATETEAAERRIAELEQELQDLDHQLAQRESARQGLDTALTNAATDLTEAQTLLRDIQQATAEVESLQAQANDKAHQVELLRKDIAQLRERDLPPAEQHATAAEEAYVGAQRHNAAAAAAHGLHVGDDCSVCNRPLPPEWQPPTAEDLDAARYNRQAAAARLTEVRDNSRDLSTRSDIISAQVTELRQEADRCQEAARTAAGLLAPLLGRNQIDLSPLPSADEVLQPLSSAVTGAREELAAHDAESQQLRDQRTAAQTNLTNAHDSLEKLRATYTRSSEEAAAVIRAFRAALTSLPDLVQINVTLPDDPLETEAIHLAGIDAAHRALSDRTQELDRREQRRMQLQQQLDRLAEDIRGLDARWANQVHAPGNELVATVNTHRDTLGDGITLLNIPDALLQPAASLSDPTELADLVRALHQATDAVTQRIHALVGAAQKDFAAARKTIDHLAAEFAIPAAGPDPADPEQVVARAEAAATEAEVEARTAQRAADDFAKLTAPLTRLRDTGEELNLAYKVLKDLSAALKPGAFPKWLTLRRSRALLVHASRLLEQMTSERYAFAELDDENAEWRIIDNDSGLARTPASLSGGEQFITSLALALGMVEMMARSGGRLESIWLDEGFGSLDRSNLDAAIEALASVAARGRMVAVISHVRAVADQVSHVLAVTREVTGTTTKWLDQNQRTQLATADIEDDFALSGLLD